jgi:two-component system, sensor histidine kinase and response regulator
MARILIVDDEKSIRVTLREFLQDAGYDVETAEDATVAAVQQLPSENFDVVVSDIVMPGITGVELLQAIHKESPHLQVIMIAGQPTVETAAAAVRAGAFDYLIKPISKETILRCVGNAVRLKQAQDERERLEAINRRNQENLEQQNRQLQAANQHLRDLETFRDNLVHMIVHDLRSPIAAMLGYLDLLRTKLGGRLQDAEKRYFDNVRENTGRLISMIASLVDANRLEAGELPLKREPHDLAGLAQTVVESMRAMADDRTLRVDLLLEPVMVHVDKEIVERVLATLLGNAIKASFDKGRIRVMVSRLPSMARVAVTDEGPGIRAEYHGKIFDKFGVVERGARQYTSGMGLVFSKLAVEAHGGRIGVESEVGKGCTFWFTLPTD